MSMNTHRPARGTLIPAALFLVLTAVLAAAGCTVKQTVYLDADGSGTAEIHITLHPVLERYMRDLTSLSSEVPEDEPIFDPVAIERTFQTISDLELLSAEVPSPAELTARVRFYDLAAVFTDELPEGVRSPALFTRRGGAREAVFYLDYDNYLQMMARFLSLAALDDYQEYVTALLEPGPREVIIDMYRYAFEDYLEEGQTVVEMLEGSTVELKVDPRGNITAQTGGTLTDGAVVFTLPLIEILTMEEPFSYLVRFQ